MNFQDWGLVEYGEALSRQEALAEDVFREKSSGTVVFCSHPPVVTRGRATKPGDVTTWSGPQIEISRGGRATYHGPSQLVIYPIWNLEKASAHRPARDIGIFLRQFEEAIVRGLAHFGITAHGKTYRPPGTSRDLEDTGVWVASPGSAERKVASLGIAIRKWVSFHGAALNVEQDPEAFRGLLPCGYRSEVMVSMQEILGRAPDRSELQSVLRTELALRL